MNKSCSLDLVYLQLWGGDWHHTRHILRRVNKDLVTAHNYRYVSMKVIRRRLDELEARDMVEKVRPFANGGYLWRVKKTEVVQPGSC